ncbi:MAG: type II secretion system protein, partial [Propionibacteriales bacterium]|nr:type II secretion system protein [Propionibacteriales bacterium]
MKSFRSHSRALVSPKPSGVGGFTLIEIMIVVSIVTILSTLAMIVIGRVQDRAARSLIENNLRQLYQAKEYYFTETGDADSVKFVEL